MQTLFHCRDQEDAEYYARLVGHNTVQSKTKSRSFGKGTSRSVNVSAQKRDLLNPDEFKTLPMDKCVITITNSYPIFADKIMYYKEEIFDGLINKEPSEVLNLLEVIPDDNQVIQVQKTENQTQNTVSQEPDIDREAQEAMRNERLGNSDDNGISPADKIDIISDDEVTADEADDYVLNMFRLVLKEAGQDLIGDTSLSDFVDEILGT
ncbi:MAG: type IV secretory system conjugative DNA transfer family protein, partial [Neisseriaceae bacterium]|nr:type IV secretory system conjugative DNA transfer family protein [Neisseriaceae bacterium]